MADDDNSLFDRARSFVARLGPGQDENPSVQARDEDPHTVGREEFREEADELDIGRFVREYNRNPLIRVPIQNFASDVTEPGVSVEVDTEEDADVPVVPDSAPDEYAGRDLDDALEQWLSQCYIDGWSYHGDIGALFENVIKDRRGRRGTAIIEHVYDDARERERLMKLRPVRVETVTAYTREGKRIVLRGDDDAGSFDTIAVSDYGDPVRDIAPKTPAGQTAAIAQFDDVFGSQEREEIPFAYGDISFSAYDSDTGVLFGRPDSATVLNRARSLRKKLRHVDQSVTNTAFGNILAQVETQQREVVESVRDNLDVNIKDRGVRDENPQTVSATNAEIDVHEIDASVPDVVDIIQQEIEFILTAMPTPLYRVGFAGDINRDVTSEQGEDYRDAVKRERRRLEDDFRRMLRLKAKGLLLGNPHTDDALDVDVALRIRPSTSESPLRDEEFDASEFSNLMSGLSTAAGPKGGATAILPKEVIIDTVLDMDPEAVLDDDTPPGDNAPAMPAQSDAVQAAFEDFTDANLAAGPFSDIPVLPDDLETLTGAWVNRWAEWIAAGRPEIPDVAKLVEPHLFAELDWNPAAHPRDPDTGKFVERPFGVPGDAPDFGEMSTKETLSYIDENGGDVAGTVFDPGTPVTVDGVPNDATSLDDIPDDPDEIGNNDTGADVITTESLPDDAAEFRRGFDTVEAIGEPLDAEDVEVGDTVTVGDGLTGAYIEVEEIADPEFKDDLVFRGTNAAGDTRTARSSKGTIREAGPVEKPEFDLEWSDDVDTRQSDLTEVIEATVPTGDDAPLDYASMPLPEEGEREGFLDDVRPAAAEGLAVAQDPEVAEETLARWSQLGDNGPGAEGMPNFSGTTRVAGQKREAIKITWGGESTAKHEVAHNIYKSFGLSGQSNGAAHDYEGNIPDFDLSTTGDDIDNYTVSPPDETPLNVDPDAESFGRSEWEPRVRGEVSERLSGNRFSTPDDFETWATEEAETGDMLRFEEYPLQTFDEDGPQNYRISETLPAADVDVVGARRGFELEAPGGETFRVGVRRNGEIKSADIHETNGFLPEANKKRNGTPDGWGSTSPDLDAVLGNEDPSDSPTERIHRVGREANAAWFKMNLLKENTGESDAEEATIGGNYSSTNTHETLARLHEYVQSDRSATENQNTAVALVKHHPRLLESYRHAFEIPDEMRQEINGALAGTDAEVRL